MPTQQRPLKHASIMTATAFLLAALAGCMAGDATASSSLYVKDDLTEHAAEVHVTFTQVQALPAAASAWVTVWEGQRTIDLLALSAPEAREKLADLDLAPGAYDGLRIAVVDVRLVLHNGSQERLIVAGNVLELAEDFEVDRSGGLRILVDIDLAEGVDVAAGVFAPIAAEMRTSARDVDGDGVSDFDDLDDTGLPPPAQGRTNWFGLCTAWHNAPPAQNETSAVAESPAFQNLSRIASGEGTTIEALCQAQVFPGPPEAIPEEARAYYEAAMEAREAAKDRADEERARGDGAADNRTADNRTGQPSPSPTPSGSPGSQGGQGGG